LHGARHRRAWGRIFGIAVLDLCNTLLMLCSLLFLPASVRDHAYRSACAIRLHTRTGAVQVMLTLFFSLSLIFTALWSAAYLGQKLTRTRSAALCVVCCMLCAAPCVLRVRLHVAGCRAACCTFHAVSALLHVDAACHMFRRMLHVLWCKQCDRRGPCVGRHATHRRRTSAHRVTRRAPPTIPTPRTLCGDPDHRRP